MSTDSSGFSFVIGKSLAMQNLMTTIHKVSTTNANVLITGESGSGKEVVARAIHESSARGKGPFVPLNCAAIPEALLESELFGHARGAFTGALHEKIGLFEEAEGGTLFLDEIGDLNIDLQSKLLRVLQDRKIRPVGGGCLKKVDVRIIAATHQDLPSLIKMNKFREDLYYRLHVIPIHLPPLRDRLDDIEPLAHSFIAKYAYRNGVAIKYLNAEAMILLKKYSWPGNVRELENLMERALLLSEAEYIEVALIREFISEIPASNLEMMQSDRPTLQALEERYIRRMLYELNDKKEQVAKVLGISRRTLYRKERAYGLVPDEKKSPEFYG